MMLDGGMDGGRGVTDASGEFGEGEGKAEGRAGGGRASDGSMNHGTGPA